MRKSFVYVVTSTYLLCMIFCLSLLGQAEELNALEIWQKVVEANKAWLEPYEGDVAYELQWTGFTGKENTIKLWSQGANKIKYQVSMKQGSKIELLFNANILQFLERDYLKIFYNVPPPLHVKSACLDSPRWLCKFGKASGCSSPQQPRKFRMELKYTVSM